MFPHLRRRIACGIATGFVFVIVSTVSEAAPVSLESLLAGGSLQACDKTFSNFRGFKSNASGGATPADPANIFASPDETDCMNPGIRWQGGTVGAGAGIGPPPFAEAGEWDVDAGQTQQTVWAFDVTAGPGFLIKDNELAIGQGAVVLTGVISIDESASSVLGSLVAEKSVFLMLGTNQLTDHRDFPGQPGLTVFVDIGLDSGPNGAAGLATFTQHFSQEIVSVPEPGLACLIGTAVLVALRRRDRRRARGHVRTGQVWIKAAWILPVILVCSASAMAAPYLPPGLAPGELYHLMFVTQGERNAKSNDIDDYNAFVNAEAA